jgi:mRNA interferase MazF
VLSPASYNRRSGLMLCCRMTSQRKGYPFEVMIPGEPDHESVVLADQVKSLDWKVRKAVKKGTALIGVIAETLSKLQTLL